jgi:hypothetical protein
MLTKILLVKLYFVKRGQSRFLPPRKRITDTDLDNVFCNWLGYLVALSIEWEELPA